MCPCMVSQENYNASPLRVCMDHVYGFEHTYSYNLPCGTHGIAIHGVATHVTAMQVTHLDKYLTMLERQNFFTRL